MATTHTLLISAETLKQTTTISQSVSADLIPPIIMVAQDRFIQPVLGTDLFEKLKTEVEGTPSGEYLVLLRDYVSKALCQFTLSMLYNQVRLRVVNNSVVQMDNEQGASVDFDSIEPLVNEALENGMFYRERMIDFITDKGASVFPEMDDNTGAGEMDRTTRNYYSGINMDRNIGDNMKIKSILSAIGVKGLC